MNIFRLKEKNKRYKIRTKGVTLDFNQQLTLYRRLERLQDKVPNDSTIELIIGKNDFYEAQLIVKGSIFGCNLKTSSSNFSTLISNIFRCTDEEIEVWEKALGYYDAFSPYFGGYPSYYKELTV